jgi:hypothetical protein
LKGDVGYFVGGFGFTGVPGGPYFDSVFSDVWRYEGSNWTRVSPSNATLGGRKGGMLWATQASDGSGELFHFGGELQLAFTFANDMFVFNVALLRWSKVVVESDSPLERASGATWQVGRQLFVFGGQSRLGILADMWRFDLDTRRWSEVVTARKPTARYGASAWTLPGSLMLFGGTGVSEALETGKLADTWLFDIPSQTWSRVGAAFPANYVTNWTNPMNPSARAFAGSWVDRRDSNPYLFGGEDARGSLLSDVWHLNVASQRWVLTSDMVLQPFQNTRGCYNELGVLNVSSVMPGRQSFAVFALANDEVVIFGGVGPNNNPALVGRVGVVEDTWKLVYRYPRRNDLPAILIPLLILLALLILLVLWLLWCRRRRQKGTMIVDFGGGQFKANTLFKPSPLQSTYDMQDLLQDSVGEFN